MNLTTALVATILLALLSLTVGAQVYRWVDKDGKVQYSDQPPPSGAGKAEAAKINFASPPASGAAPAKPADKVAGKAKPTDADKAKTQAEEARTAKQNEEYCRDVRSQVRALQDGGRFASTDEKGERVYMNEEQMSAEITRLQKLIAESCK